LDHFSGEISHTFCQQGCQVAISKKGQINSEKKPYSTEKSQIHDKYTTTPLKHPNVHLKGNMYICIYFIHKKNKAYSINELLETIGFPEEQPETADL